MEKDYQKDGGNKMKKPNLFIVGAAKSGTTALHEFLKQHPDIFMSDRKELRFFDKDSIKRSYEYLYKNRYNPLKRRKLYRIRTEEEYLNNFIGWGNEKIAGESSPQYLISKVSAREIHQFNPKAKIIIMLREPVDWMYSYHAQSLLSGYENVNDFGKALALEKDRRGGKKIPKFSRLTDPYSELFYSEMAKFSKQVKRYLNVFERQQIKIIIYDDFKEDNAGVYREVLDFLGVDPNFKPDFGQINIRKEVRFRKFRILLLSLFGSRNFRKILRWPKRHLPLRARTAYTKAYTKLLSFPNSRVFIKTGSAAPIDSELREELMKKFKPEVKRLSEITGRDLVSLWGYETIK
jgi:hypothetical protein